MRTLLLRGLAGLAIVVALAAAGTVFLVAVFDLQVEWAGSGFRPLFSFGDPDDHFAGLDADRASQRSAARPDSSGDAVAVGAPVASPEPLAGGASVTTPSAVAGLAAGATAAAAPADPPAPPDAASGRDAAAWTDFRGPHRDGRYTGPAIRTDWPADGFDPLWSQPIGGGYASFCVFR